MKINLVNENIRHDYVNQLLKSCGIEDTDRYLNPKLSDIEDPGLLKNIEEGFWLLKSCLGEGKRIYCCFDSDMDGYTSGAIIYQYIKDISPETEIKIDIHDGKQHGLEDKIDFLLSSDTHFDLIIQPDAGSNDYEYHEQLRSIGTRVLVLDHHILDSEVSSNAIIINNQDSPLYTNKDLSGAGVTWQFCRYVDYQLGHTYSHKYIDLAALGIISDMMKLNNYENRAIIKFGLENINNYFFQALIEKQDYSMKGKINPTTIAFYITPLVNAMVRSGTYDQKMNMAIAFIDGNRMIESNKRGAKGALERVCVESARECTNARSRQNKKLDEIEFSIEAKVHKLGLLDNKVLFVRLEDEEDFPSTLNGLLATRLMKKFNRPTIIARLNNEGYVRGSARSPDNCELDSFKNFLEKSSLFEYASGHDRAFGLSILNKDLNKFHEYANTSLKDIDFDEDVYNVNFSRLAADEDLSQLILNIANKEELWGQGISTPLIYITGINLKKSEIQIIGQKKNVVKFTKFGVEYIKFSAEELIEELEKYNEVSLELVGEANINSWMGKNAPQITINGWELHDGALSF